MAPAHVQRLRHLHLIEVDRGSWRLTTLGQHRLNIVLRSNGDPEVMRSFGEDLKNVADELTNPTTRRTDGTPTRVQH